MKRKIKHRASDIYTYAPLCGQRGSVDLVRSDEVTTCKACLHIITERQIRKLKQDYAVIEKSLAVGFSPLKELEQFWIELETRELIRTGIISHPQMKSWDFKSVAVLKGEWDIIALKK